MNLANSQTDINRRRWKIY